LLKLRHGGGKKKTRIAKERGAKVTLDAKSYERKVHNIPLEIQEVGF